MCDFVLGEQATECQESFCLGGRSVQPPSVAVTAARILFCTSVDYNYRRCDACRYFKTVVCSSCPGDVDASLLSRVSVPRVWQFRTVHFVWR